MVGPGGVGVKARTIFITLLIFIDSNHLLSTNQKAQRDLKLFSFKSN